MVKRKRFGRELSAPRWDFIDIEEKAIVLPARVFLRHSPRKAVTNRLPHITDQFRVEKNLVKKSPPARIW